MHAPFRHLLVPVDGSEPSLRALDAALGLARATGATLTVATVLDLGQLDFFDGMYLSHEQVERWQELVKLEVLEVAEARLGGFDARLRLLRGAVVPALLAEAEAAGVDLFVLGRSGKGALDRLAHGSVSHRLGAASPIPVLTVP
jgi:nucleotide-binding universal stress UspA family protein